MVLSFSTKDVKIEELERETQYCVVWQQSRGCNAAIVRAEIKRLTELLKKSAKSEGAGMHVRERGVARRAEDGGTIASES